LCAALPGLPVASGQPNRVASPSRTALPMLGTVGRRDGLILARGVLVVVGPGSQDVDPSNPRNRVIPLRTLDVDGDRVRCEALNPKHQTTIEDLFNGWRKGGVACPE
jgi:hypothetical protein